MGSWDTASVADMASMFRGARAFNQDIGSWDTASVADMFSMFRDANAFNSDIGGWDTRLVNNMNFMFQNASTFDQNLGNWDVSLVTTMQNMFNGSDVSLQTYDSTLTGWGTQSVQSNVAVGASGLTYDEGADDRQSLIDSHNWTFTGDSILDTDNDTVGDFYDLDDDNDGMLDSVDKRTETSDNTGYSVVGTQATGQVGNVALTVTDETHDLISTTDGVTIGTTSGGEESRITIAFGEPVDSFELSIRDLDLGESLSVFSLMPSSVDAPYTLTAGVVNGSANDQDASIYFSGLGGRTELSFIATRGTGDFAINVESAVIWSDTDSDGISDRKDLDSDNDGISDLQESGADVSVLDTGGDGLINGAAFVDADTDGLSDAIEAAHGADTGTPAANSDSDSIADYRDLDSDGDGIADWIEAQDHGSYVGNDGDVTDDDADGDGIIAAFDSNDASTGVFGGSFSAPVNTDSDALADYIDTDSDGDTQLDAAESGLSLPGSDANNDGIDEHASIGASYADPDGVNNDPANDINAAYRSYENTAPVFIDLAGSTQTFVEDGSAVVLDADVAVSDLELDALNSGNGNYAGSTLTLVRNGGANADDVLSMSQVGGFTLVGGDLLKGGVVIGTFDTTTTAGQLVITFSDTNQIPTSADVDAIVQQLTYSNTNDTPPGSVIIDWTFSDGNSADAQGTGPAKTATDSTTVIITATNDAPLLDLDADNSTAAGSDFSATWTEGSGPILIADSDATFSDVDSTNPTQVTVTLTNLLDGGNEYLAADTTGTSVVASYDGVTGVLTLSGSDTVANYQQVLRTVTYNNASEEPDATGRIITFVASDGTNVSPVATTTVNVTATNDAPVITSDGGAATATISVDENQATVTTVTATDVDDSDTQTYSLSGGADQAAFSVNAGTGALTFNTAPNHETQDTYVVEVTVTDSGSLTDTQLITVTVDDVNEAPVISSDGGAAAAAVSVDENQTTVTTVTATDVDDGDTQAYSIIGGADAASFSINGSSGALTFNTAPDFETSSDAGTNNVYDVTIQVADGNGGTDTQAIAVTVTNINEAPVIDSGDVDGGVVVDLGNGDTSLTITVNENQMRVIQVSATDADAQETRTYSLTGGTDQSAFTIDSGTGDLNFVSPPDHEVKERYQVEVTVTDSGGLTAVQTLVINVQDVNESPTAQTDVMEANENQQLVIDPVSSLLSNDFDPEQDLLTLVSFTQPQHGTLVLNAQGMLVYEPDDFFVGLDQFDYVVEDAGGNQVSARVWLDVRAFSDPILQAAQPVDNEVSESSVLNPENAETNQSGVSTEIASAYPQEATPNTTTGSSEPAATSEETPSSAVAAGDQFTASVSIPTSGQTSGSAHLQPPTRINGPIISGLLQQLLDHEFTDLNASFELQIFEQSASIELRDAIRALRGQIDQMFDQPSESSPLITFAPSVVGASITAGIVTWVLRSGLLLSATITATPLWRPLDPVPILAQSNDDEDEPWYEKGTSDALRNGTTAANDPDRNEPGGQDVKRG
ncbi:MAG: BspA family leucine-rich repeat surface protein [Granulosicoccus sp.]